VVAIIAQAVAVRIKGMRGHAPDEGRLASLAGPLGGLTQRHAGDIEVVGDGEVGLPGPGRQVTHPDIAGRAQTHLGKQRVDQHGPVGGQDPAFEQVAAMVEHPGEMTQQPLDPGIALDPAGVRTHPRDEPGVALLFAIRLVGDVVGEVVGEVLPDIHETRLHPGDRLGQGDRFIETALLLRRHRAQPEQVAGQSTETAKHQGAGELARRQATDAGKIALRRCDDGQGLGGDQEADPDYGPAQGRGSHSCLRCRAHQPSASNTTRCGATASQAPPTWAHPTASPAASRIP